VSLTEKLSEEANKKMPYGESNGHVTDDVTRPWKVKVSANALRAKYLENSWRCYIYQQSL